MTLALRKYPKPIWPHRYARNGLVPEAPMARRLINGQNHILAYRRKQMLTANDTAPANGVASRVERFYTHYRTGYGATHIGYVIGAMADVTATGTDPYVEVLTSLPDGTGSTTTELHTGLSASATTDCPDSISWFTGRQAVSPNTDYQTILATNDYARIQSALIYEIGSDIVDDSVDYYIEDSPTIEFPIYDSIRQKHAEGLSNMWKKNAGHLMGWYGRGDDSVATFNSTTWTNVIDAATSVTASTAGFYLGDGDKTLEAWRRYSSSGLEVKLAVHCKVQNSATAEVRLQNSGGTVISITGMGTTQAWYETTGTITSLDTLAKCDLQCRTSNGANTVTLYAVVLYPYVA